MVSDGIKSWRFTRFYGNPRLSERSQSWELLKKLSKVDDMPWLDGGDFNEILSVEDKRGGAPQSCGALIAFQACLDGCDLTDLKWRGNRFTWSNRQTSTARIEERLDRFRVNGAWLSQFDVFQVNHMLTIGFDHAIIKMQFGGLGDANLPLKR